jgi:hypothetical protein
LWGKSPDPRLQWELRISAITGETAPSIELPVHPVIGLRFSPDGRWIAAAVTHSRSSATETPDELVIVPVDGNPAAVTRFSLPQIIIAGLGSPGIYWSMTSEYIALDTRFNATVVRVSDGRQCVIPQHAWHVGGFIDNQNLIIADYDRPGNPRSFTINSSSISVYRSDCALVASWNFRGRIDVIEAYAPTGIAGVDPDESEVRVITAETGALLKRLPFISGGLTSLRFGAKGEVLCVGGYPASGELACYSATYGSKVARHPTIKGGAPFDVSIDNTMVLASEGVEHYNPFTERTRDEWKAWVVWDFRSGRDVARLKYRTQRTGRSVGKKEEKIPFASAISPDGRRFAIAGEDVVQLYEIPR